MNLRRTAASAEPSAVNAVEMAPGADGEKVGGLITAAMSLEDDVVRSYVAAIADGARASMAIAAIDVDPFVVPGAEEWEPRAPQAEAEEGDEGRARVGRGAEARLDLLPMLVELDRKAQAERADRWVAAEEGDGRLRSSERGEEVTALDATLERGDRF